MPFRRAFLAGLAALAASPSTAAARRPRTADDGASTVAPVDASAAVAAANWAGDHPFGRVDFAALRTARRDARRADVAPVEGAPALDRRLAPVFGTGVGAPAGLRSLSGELSAGASLRRLRDLADDHRGLRTARDGETLAVDAAAGAARAVEGDAPRATARRQVQAALSDADAYTGLATRDAVADDRPSPDALAGVHAFGVGVDGVGSAPRLRAHFAADESFDLAAAKRVLAAFGVPAPVLADATGTRKDGGLAVRASLGDGQSSLAVLLVLLVLPAVVGTFVLGLGSRPPGDRMGNDAPQVSFEFELTDQRRVQITHQGGDTVSDLAVAYEHDGSRVFEEWRGEISAGSRYTTRRSIDPGGTLRLHWRSADGNGAATLGSFTAP